MGMNDNRTISTSLFVVAAIAVLFVGSLVVVVLPEVNAARPAVSPPCEDRLAQNDNVCRGKPVP